MAHRRPVLHLLSVPHTVTDRSFSHCAFTQKVRKFGPMLRAVGYDVLHYGVAGADSGATADVVLMEQDEHQALLGHPYHAHDGGFYGDDAVDGNAVYRQFNLYAREELTARVVPGDLILLPFGHAHAAAIRGLPVLTQGAGAVESGIGYMDCLLPWRIYESEACRHATMAKEGRVGVHEHSPRLEYVVPNYWEPDDWPEGTGGDAVVFLGRITEGKGVSLVLELARRHPDIPFRIAGQGVLRESWGAVPSNVEVVGPLTRERAAYLGNARAIIAPSRYVEPFAGSVVEAALCGTPAITSAFGAFTETVEDGVTGFRCQTPEEWSRAISAVLTLDRAAVRRRALSRYTASVVGPQYARVFEAMAERLAASAFPARGW